MAESKPMVSVSPSENRMATFDRPCSSATAHSHPFLPPPMSPPSPTPYTPLSAPPNVYVCDPVPSARLAQPAVFRTSAHDTSPRGRAVPMFFHRSPPLAEPPCAPLLSPSPVPQTRKLCVRHQRMADEGTNMKLQQSLDALPVEEREAVSALWSNFSSSPHARRALILQGLLTMCCFSQLSLLTEQLAHMIRIDPFTVLPREVSLKILSYLDATSLCRAAQVAKKWKDLADDDVLWRGICEQHIGQKCRKCGWGLPIMEKKRNFGAKSKSPRPHNALPTLQPLMDGLWPAPKRRAQDDECGEQPYKRQRSDGSSTHSLSLPLPSFSSAHTRSTEFESVSHALLASRYSPCENDSVTRPWKDVYSERMTVERNWRRGRCTVRTFAGHTDGVMCLQFCETFAHPEFPVLITGSYDHTVRVWNMDTGAELHCLKGHTRAVRALQFDDVKLITGSMDSTIRVWDWRRGRCVRTLTGHSEGVVCLNFDDNVLASGSADATVRVWNLRTGGAFTLRGHSDWVNAVQLWDTNGRRTSAESADTGESRNGSRNKSGDSKLAEMAGGLLGNGCAGAPQIDPGKMLFSASDDGTIRLWDLTLRTCVRQFMGHVGQVQSMKLLLTSDECADEVGGKGKKSDEAGGMITKSTELGYNTALSLSERSPSRQRVEKKKPLLISGSLDNTIKLWDIETGKTIRTLFGHIEGVWAVASDKLRLVSGSQDRTIKVWSREDARCTATLVGHQAAVSCIALGEDKIVSGSDDHLVKVWSFSE